MKLVVASVVALSFASSAFAQEWPKQEWRLFKVTSMSAQTPASAKRDGGAYPPESWMTGAAVGLGGPAPGSRQNVALDLDSVSRAGNKVELRYFVWPDDRSSYTEITSLVDCSKTGEQVVLLRQYDQDFAYVRASSQGVRRTDATARAVANHACHPSRGSAVGGKSLPEIVQGR